MSVTKMKLEHLSEDDLLTLVDDKVPEGRDIDYKIALPGNSDSEKKEFLYDVSSFANSSGGHLIFGVDEKAGVAINVPGIQCLDPDKAILRLEQLVRDGIKPPIPGLQSIAVRLAGGNIVIVMRIPQSWSPPHQVVYQKSLRFYGRGTNGKYGLEVDELRDVFGRSDTIGERANAFRLERIAKIIAEETPVPLNHGARVVTHVAPLSSFSRQQVVDINKVWSDRTKIGVVTGGTIGVGRFNIDGVLSAEFTGSDSLLQVVLIRPSPR
jgi:Putative DNA-binding domain